MTTLTIEKRQSSRIERLAIKLWGYARDHCRSLDSERHRAAIVQMVVDDIAWHDDMLEDTRRKLATAEATVEANIKQLIAEGYTQQQAIAIAMDKAKEGRK